VTGEPPPAGAPALHQLNLVVQDMDASIAFYRLLGLPIEAEEGAPHVEVELASGISLELDAAESVSLWDSAWVRRPGGAVVLGFGLASREAVDELHARLTGAGYRDHQPPFDVFWGGRYAIVDDPDGNPVGLSSPVDPDRRAWPPTPPPAAAV
jgi:catechol 2,3-dioxygenase-like lactoylglutathione lyase family enzyme